MILFAKYGQPCPVPTDAQMRRWYEIQRHPRAIIEPESVDTVQAWGHEMRKRAELRLLEADMQDRFERFFADKGGEIPFS